MEISDTHHQRMAKLTFASVYPLYIAKVEKKGSYPRRIRSGDQMAYRI